MTRNDSNGFICTKNITKQGAEKAFNYKTYAMYKDLKCDIYGSYKTGLFELDTCDWVDVRTYNELLEKVGNYGFKIGYPEGHGRHLFTKKVSPDDPDLQIFEECTELDVNAL